MYPVLPFLERKCCSDYELSAHTGTGTIMLLAGTGVYIPVLGLHFDAKYFPEPQKFDPDRFTEENKHGRPNYIYEGFPCFFLAKTGHGPHSSKIVVLFYVLEVLYCSMYCLCVNVYCHRVTTQLQLTNISYHIFHLGKVRECVW